MESKFLTIHNLRKVYAPEISGGVIALNDLSFSIDGGDFVTIVGRNAAGKTTLFNAIAGSIAPTSGDIILEGKSILKDREFERSDIISRVRQNPNDSVINSMTLAENLAMAKLRGKHPRLCKGVKKEWRDEFMALLKPLDLGLEKRLDDKMNLLSGGQKQTVALLMATIIKPKLLLLDEHTAALDPKTSEKVLEITNKIVHENKVTTLMITHNIHHAINYGNRLILLDRGKIGFEAVNEEKKKLNAIDVVKKLEKVT